MLTQKQKRLIAALNTVGSVKEACSKAEISRKTYYNWLENPEFIEELNNIQQAIYNESVIEIRNLFKNAVQLYENLMKSDNESIQLRVATAIISNAGKFSDIKALPKRKEEPIKDLFKEIEEYQAVFDKLRRNVQVPQAEESA